MYVQKMDHPKLDIGSLKFIQHDHPSSLNDSKSEEHVRKPRKNTSYTVI